MQEGTLFLESRRRIFFEIEPIHAELASPRKYSWAGSR
jgi:hypothetical protein